MHASSHLYKQKEGTSKAIQSKGDHVQALRSEGVVLHAAALSQLFGMLPNTAPESFLLIILAAPHTAALPLPHSTQAHRCSFACTNITFQGLIKAPPTLGPTHSPAFI